MGLKPEQKHDIKNSKKPNLFFGENMRNKMNFVLRLFDAILLEKGKSCKKIISNILVMCLIKDYKPLGKLVSARSMGGIVLFSGIGETIADTD